MNDNDNYIFSGANTKTVTYTFDENGDIVPEEEIEEEPEQEIEQVTEPTEP